MADLIETVDQLFHGKERRITRFFWKMKYGLPGAWGEAGRAQRAEVQALLGTIGLEMKLEERKYSNDRYWKTGKRRKGEETRMVGILVPLTQETS